MDLVHHFLFFSQVVAMHEPTRLLEPSRIVTSTNFLGACASQRTQSISQIARGRFRVPDRVRPASYTIKHLSLSRDLVFHLLASQILPRPYCCAATLPASCVGDADTAGRGMKRTAPDLNESAFNLKKDREQAHTEEYAERIWFVR